MKLVAIVLGVIFAIAAILTITGAAHVSHTLGFDGHRHVKHTLLYGAIAVICFAWARMAEPVPARSR